MPYEASYDLAQEGAGRKVLRNTYLLLAVTMIPTVLGALLGIEFASVMMGSPIITFVVMIASIIGLQFGIAAYRNSGIGVALLLLMTGLLGVFMGPLLNVALSMRNGTQLVAYAAVGTGIIFFAMSVIASTLKRDLQFLGKFAMVGLLIAIVANLFLQIPALALTISTLVIVVFAMFLVYDLNRIIRGGETNYIMATTGVYISLLNIFSCLLHLLIALGGEKD